MRMMVKGEVKTVSLSVVHPEVPPPVSSIFLPSFDALWQITHYNRRFLFYSVHPDRFPSALTLLRTSLRRALAHFYPWTGRLARGVDGRLFIDFAKESGVEFVVASADFSYLDLCQDGFQYRPFFDKLCKWNRHDHSQIYDMPLLSIQVTEFRDGGMALAFAHSHVVADGTSIWHFMKSWSECARGLPISSPPLHERDRFLLRNPSEELAWMPYDDLIYDIVDPHKEEEEDDDHASKEENAPLSQSRFLFTAEMFCRLKALALEGGGGSGPFTTYEVLCAHFWKRVTEARVLKPSAHVHFKVLANCRSRVKPSLPSSYFGNCVSSVYVQTTASQILTESLAATALRVRGGIERSIDVDASFHRFSHWLELHNNSTIGFASPKDVGMLAAGSPHFPCYEVDFGPTTGSPKGIGTALIKCDGEMILYPTRHNNGSIDISMALKPQVMDRLLSDPCFLNF